MNDTLALFAALTTFLFWATPVVILLYLIFIWYSPESSHNVDQRHDPLPPGVIGVVALIVWLGQLVAIFLLAGSCMGGCEVSVQSEVFGMLISATIDGGIIGFLINLSLKVNSPKRIKGS